jgi:hypothetical protein
MDTQSAIERRDIGIHRAVEKAESDDSGWSWRAYYAVLKFLVVNKTPFLTEDVREWAESNGHIPVPKNGKAWGAVMQRAARRGVIKKVGYDLAKSSNLSPKVLWQRKDDE